jgi:hypothetical protein
MSVVCKDWLLRQAAAATFRVPGRALDIVCHA